ncbi:hypothetical protein [Cyclobacterium qasimii]|nr:hypothetical protein [Cyclobacterium qasimii]
MNSLGALVTRPFTLLIFKYVISILLIFLALSFSVNAQPVKVNASSVTFTSPSERMTSIAGCGFLSLEPCYSASVANSGNALIDNSQFARMYASPGLVAGLASYDGELELKFDFSLPADTWSYVRIDAGESLLQALLGGSLGELIGDVLGSVLLGNQEIEIQARNSGGGYGMEIIQKGIRFQIPTTPVGCVCRPRKASCRHLGYCVIYLGFFRFPCCYSRQDAA